MKLPEILIEKNVTIVAPGPGYDSIYEGVLGQFDAVLELAKSADPPLMLLDLRHTHYVGSAFLGLIRQLSVQIRTQRQGRFGACHLTKFCKVLFATTQLDQVCELFDTREEAIASFVQDQPATS